VGTSVVSNNRSSVDAAFHGRAKQRGGLGVEGASQWPPRLDTDARVRGRILTIYQCLSAASCPMKESSAGHTGPPEACARALTRSLLPA